MCDRCRCGFTLIELMIVVVLIALVAAIASPILTRARAQAHEASAVASLKIICAGAQLYEVRFRTFPASLADLEAADYLDSGLALGNKGGYTFTYAATDTTFQVNADPDVPGTSGDHYFYVDESGVVRWAEGGPASDNDSPIGDWSP